MELRVFTEPQQGASYDDLLRVAQKTEELGFGAFFRSDHFLGFGGDVLPGPTDAWVTLAALARETSTIRLGTLVTSVTFRSPGLLAIQVAQVDQMSGGRVELGIGAGWFAKEHAAYGFAFPEPPERFDMLEDQLAIVTGLWATDGGFSYAGKQHSVTDSPGLPKPHQTKPPIIMGGGGKKRTAALAARYADEYNLAFDGVRGRAPEPRTGQAGVRGRRPRPRVADHLQRVGALCRQGRGGVPATRGCDRPRPGRAAGEPARRHRERGRSTRSAGTSTPARAASTSRPSTSTTSTTCTWSPSEIMPHV